MFWVDPQTTCLRRHDPAPLQPDNHALLYRTHELVYQALLDPSK